MRTAIIQNKSYVYQKKDKYDKNQLILFFCEKPVSKPVVITYFLKTLSFMTTIPFNTFPWDQLCHIWHVINETR